MSLSELSSTPFDAVKAAPVLAENANNPAVLPFYLANLDNLFNFLGGKGAQDVKNSIQDSMEKLAKIDSVSEPAVENIAIPICAQHARENTKWQVKVAALKLLELWAASAPEAVCNSMVSLVPLLSELMWDSKKQVKDQAKATLTAACQSIDNVDLDPFIGVLITAIENPETVEDCVQGLAATTFVQAVKAAALSITVPLLDRGFKERKIACVRQTAKVTENLAKLVADPSDVAPFMPVLGPALAKAKNDISDPECRSRCAAAHEALLAIGTMDEAQIKAKENEQVKLKQRAAEVAKTVCKGMNPAVVNYCASSLAGLCKTPVLSFWEDSLLEGLQSLGVDEAKRIVGELFNQMASKPTEKASEIVEDDGAQEGDILCDCRFSLAYGSKILLNQARMKLVKGRRYALVGTKAAGKTTLLKAIANGQVEGWPTNLKTVFVEADVLHSEAKVVDFVFESMKGEGVTKDQVKEGLLKVGFDDHHLSLPVMHLSGGWRIKTAMARAMLRNAQILLLDQPTNHLDVKNVQWVADYLTGDLCKDVSFLIVTHDLNFANKVATNVIHFTPALKLDSYVGNMEAFFERKPEIRQMFDISDSDTPFVFPPPAPIEGLKAKGSKCMSLTDVTFTYPGAEKPQLNNVNVRLSMASRVSCVGPNGAGKSTLVKLLIGALTPSSGTVYKHPNVRVAYVGQHAFEYIEDHLNKTPNEYIRWRYDGGDDKEALNKANMVITPEERAVMEKPIEVSWVDEEGKHQKEKRIIEALLGRRKEKNGLVYEAKFRGKTQDSNIWYERDWLVEKGFEKWVAAIDRRKLAAEGAYTRVLSQKNVEEHLVGTGLDSESATHTRMSQLSSGQRIKVVLAAALWYLPHLLILDEPTNYASRDDLASLAKAINTWGGGVLLITHSEAFAKLTTRETWLVQNNQCEVSGDNVDWVALEKEAMDLGLNYQEDQVDIQGNKIDRAKKQDPASVKPKDKKIMLKTLKDKIAKDLELSEFEYACATAWGLWQ